MELTPKVEFMNLTFDVTVMIGTLFTALIVFLVAILATRSRKWRPTGLQNVVEMLIDFSRGMTRMAYDDKTAEKYLAFTFTLFLFIFVANEIGVLLMVTAEAHQPIPWLGLTEEALEENHGVSWFRSPTADLNVTLAMAIAVALYSHFAGIRSSFKNYVGHYLSPLLPIHLIEEFSKPLTHAMRLWANIFAGEILITVMLTMGSPWITGAPLLVWIGFSLFVGVIQAYIFTVLANVYISQKLAHH
ncbi:F0F1 ATP synthase subunit A [Paludifilum halophilum]|uniref:ATP synthase subunit a n=1 Tax=Paludifilum halophilum TaxID=1642702 RepID=A0A235B6T7_9BACL|nr:F0F1 ATP synthase subunit A [Paludifilum halophilum]OYD08006.1 ATP synthase F0 subunit A [Paludifilum halophilum]